MRPTAIGTTRTRAPSARPSRTSSGATSPPTGRGRSGHRRHGVQAALGQGVLRAGVRLRQQGDRGLVDLRQPRHGAAGAPARPAAGEAARGGDAGASRRHGLAVPAQEVDAPPEEGGDNPEHVAQGELHRQRRRRAGLRPHQGRVLPGKEAYRTKSVSGPIIHSFRNGYLVLWWSSSHTRPSPHFSGREASSALMPYRSLSRSTSASVGISRSVSAIVFGHSACR